MNYPGNPYSNATNSLPLNSGTPEEGSKLEGDKESFSKSLPNSASFVVLASAMLLAINMYVDRAAVGQLRGSISTELNLSDWQGAYFMGAFFWAYALGQVPAATLGLRFGFRNVLVIFLVVWSGATILTGLSNSFALLIASRLALGLAEAGAYPNANALIRGWFPLQLRGRACSAVTFGGRLGWAISQFLTPLLEAAFASWRSVLILYGVVGILLAIPFRLLAKDAPAETTVRANEDQIATESTAIANHLSLSTMLLNRNLFLYSAIQFFTNIGWVFLLSDLPNYLIQVLGVAKISTGFLSTIPPLVSCVGMLFGGLVTDLMSRRFGIRMARSVPIATMMFFCSVAYLLCPQFTNPILFVCMLSVMAVAVDFSNPSLWAFAQDVGGRNAGKVLGWGNMFGNIGAGLSPILMAKIQQSYGWNVCFYVFATCFFLAGILAMLLNAEKKISE